jgi:putative addiction module component (TIGR02574 family)
MTTEPTIEKLKHMPVSERLRLLEDVWSSLADQPEALGVPDWHRDELDARLAAHRNDPSAARAWADVKAELGDSKRK